MSADFGHLADLDEDDLEALSDEQLALIFEDLPEEPEPMPLLGYARPVTRRTVVDPTRAVEDTPALDDYAPPARTRPSRTR